MRKKAGRSSAISESLQDRGSSKNEAIRCIIINVIEMMQDRGSPQDGAIRGIIINPKIIRRTP